MNPSWLVSSVLKLISLTDSGQALPICIFSTSVRLNGFRLRTFSVSCPVLNRYTYVACLIAVLFVITTVAGCGGGDSSLPTTPTSVEQTTPTQTGTGSTKNTGMTVNGISLSELPATQTMTVLPFDTTAVTLISPYKPSHTGIDINTITGGRFLSPATGIVTLVQLNTGQGRPGTNYRVRIHHTSTGINSLYHFEVDGSISDQMQQDNILVALGDQVTVGQHIGSLMSQGPNAHVHYDMLDAGGRATVRCPIVYFSSDVAATWENLYDQKIKERDDARIAENRGAVPSLPDLCNDVELPN